jgi:hypothetical protein
MYDELRKDVFPDAFYFATETTASCFVRLVLNDIRQTGTSIHFKQNGSFITFGNITLITKCLKLTDW